MKEGKGTGSGTVLLDHLNQFGSKCKALPGLAWQMTALWVASKTFIRGILISFSAGQSETEELEDLVPLPTHHLNKIVIRILVEWILVTKRWVYFI